MTVIFNENLIIELSLRIIKHCKSLRVLRSTKNSVMIKQGFLCKVMKIVTAYLPLSTPAHGPLN